MQKRHKADFTEKKRKKRRRIKQCEAWVQLFKLELLPYHYMFDRKTAALGLLDDFNDKKYIPSHEDMVYAKEIVFGE